MTDKLPPKVGHIPEHNLPDKDDAPWLNTTYDGFNEDLFPKPMTDVTWTVMNDLQDAFNEITTFNFMLERLQKAVDENDQNSVTDLVAALNAFYPIYTANWDDRFKVAWDHVVTGQG